jgi:branched-chain amino acid transport system permease protein
VIIQQILNGLLLGATYALVSVGFSLLFGTLRIINLAYGSTVMIGAFAGVFANRYCGGGLTVALIGAMLGAMLIGAAIHAFMVRPLGNVSDTSASAHSSVLVTTIAASLILQNAVLLILGPNDVPFPRLIETKQGLVGSISVSPAQVTILGLSLASISCVWLLLSKTAWGLRVRCSADDPEGAAICGIKEGALRLQVVLLASAIAGVAGICIGLTDRSVTPLTGAAFGLKAVVAVIAGGINRLSGAVIVALCLGLSEVFAVVLLSEKFRDGFAYAALLLILFLRPGGILSTPRSRY